MDGAKSYLKDNNIVPSISFKDGQAHTVELIKDKMETINSDGEDVEGVSFLVKEDGEAKRFFTKSVGLIQKLAFHERGDIVRIQMKQLKNPKGGYMSVFEVEELDKDDHNVPAEPEEEIANPLDDIHTGTTITRESIADKKAKEVADELGGKVVDEDEDFGF